MNMIFRTISGFETICLTVALSASITISVVGVFFRYVLNNSLGFVEEAAGFLLLVMVCVGISAAVRKGTHLRVDMLIQFVPKTKRYLDLIADIIALGVMTVLLVFAVQFVASLLVSSQRVTSMYWLPLGIPLIIMPVGYLATILRLLRNLSNLLKQRNGDEIDDKDDDQTGQITAKRRTT